MTIKIDTKKKFKAILRQIEKDVRAGNNISSLEKMMLRRHQPPKVENSIYIAGKKHKAW